MNDIKWLSTSNGFCRVYYKNPKTGALLCYQLEDSRNNIFYLYECSKDGEPQWQLDMDLYNPEMPEDDIAIEKELKQFLKARK